MDIAERSNTSPWASWRWSLLVSIVTINTCVLNLLLTYGILLVFAIKNDLPTWSGFLAPTIFVFFYSITQCWSREFADSWGSNGGLRILAASASVFIASGLIACAVVPSSYQPFIYGIFGGLGASLIAAQVEVVACETYDTKLDVVKNLSYVGQAIGQAVFPYIITLFVEEYGYSSAYILLAAIITQTLPFIMFLKINESEKRISYSRYSDLAQAYAVFDNNAYEVQINKLYIKKNWKSPEDPHENFDLNDIDEFDNVSMNVEAETPPPSPEDKRRNIFGVEIMPEIPEETEGSDDEDPLDNEPNNQVNVGIKRLSSLSDCFDDYIIRHNNIDFSSEESSLHDYTSTHKNLSSLAKFRTKQTLSSQKRFTKLRRRCISSYKYYRMKKIIRYFFYSLNDTFIKPLFRSLFCWRFYPVLLLAFCKYSSMAVPIVLLPLIDLDLNPDKSMLEINFMMSLHGFSWICFLLCTPWLMQMQKKNYKYLLVIGLMIYAAAAFLIARVENRDALSVGCVVAGLGFGAINSCWEPAAQEFMGSRNWHRVRSTMETLSGSSVAAFVVLLIYISNGIINQRFTMLIMCGVYSISSIVWFVIALVSFYFEIIKRLKLRWRC